LENRKGITPKRLLITVKIKNKLKSEAPFSSPNIPKMKANVAWPKPKPAGASGMTIDIIPIGKNIYA
jgi:hypothetical protein